MPPTQRAAGAKDLLDEEQDGDPGGEGHQLPPVRRRPPHNCAGAAGGRGQLHLCGGEPDQQKGEPTSPARHICRWWVVKLGALG